jgi:hypothetical protein
MQRALFSRPVHAESTFLPLARRRAMIFLPLRVRIRTKKPWSFLRFLLLGWKVLFISFSPFSRYLASFHALFFILFVNSFLIIMTGLSIVNIFAVFSDTVIHNPIHFREFFLVSD